MDKSKEYIKMCDCPDIQEQWGYRKTIKPNVHDFVHHEEAKYTFGREVWLPRQDQIQEMLQPIELHELLDMCGNGSGIMWEALHEYADSFEQLWLAFYMLEKHKKKWDGKKWMK
jgi:hypothetical protein